MVRKIEGSVVVITGASSGIGRATARVFSRAGAKLVLAARREDALEEVAAECRGGGGRPLVIPTDTSDPDAVERLAEGAVRRHGRIDTWVNNAAVGIWGRFEDVPLDAFRRIMEVNLFGYVHGTRSALKRFREQGEGLIIQNASIVSRVPYPYMSAYVATKHAVLGFSLSLRQELALEGNAIQLGLILPATIDTPFYEHAAHYGGVLPRVMPPVYPPEQVADAIHAMARRPRRETFVGAAGKAMHRQQQMAPGVTELQAARLAERMLVEPDPYAQDDGASLFQPMSAGRGVSAGWQPDRRRAVGRATSLALLMAGGALLLVPSVGPALASSLLGLAAGIGTSKRSLRPLAITEIADTVQAQDLATTYS